MTGIEQYLQKSRLIGAKITEHYTDDNDKNKYYIIYMTNDNLIILLPDSVKGIVTEPLRTTKFNTVKVVGGSGLRTTESLFFKLNAQSIDLRELDTHNVENMSGMFSGCKAKTLYLGDFNTSKVTNMWCMFYDSRFEQLDLSNFDTRNVKNMYGMFSLCTTKVLDLRSFDTSKVQAMQYMFFECKSETIDLSSFDTGLSIDIKYMLSRCTAKIKATDKRICKLIEDNNSWQI